MAVEITGINTTPLTGKKTDNGAPTRNSEVGLNSQNSALNNNTVNASAGAASDKFTLTQQAEKLSMIEKAVNNQSDIDDERIENLRLEINTGRYDIDVNRVAEKLIEFEAQFVA